MQCSGFLCNIVKNFYFMIDFMPYEYNKLNIIIILKMNFIAQQTSLFLQRFTICVAGWISSCIYVGVCQFESGINQGLLKDIWYTIAHMTRSEDLSASNDDLSPLAGFIEKRNAGDWRLFHATVDGRTNNPNCTGCPPHGRLPDICKLQHHISQILGRTGFNDQEVSALLERYVLRQCHTNGVSFNFHYLHIKFNAMKSGILGFWVHDNSYSNAYFIGLLDCSCCMKISFEVPQLSQFTHYTIDKSNLTR